MRFEELQIDKIDPNPYQTRESFDSEILAGIATSAMDEIGIRNIPIVRPHPKNKDRYQIASGHGRLAAWKTLGHKTITCRIEELTDSQMKKEVLIENVNRSDLTENERMVALEAYRDDLNVELKIGDREIYRVLSKETGIPLKTISDAYDVKHMRELLKINISADFAQEPTPWLITRTSGLPDAERVKLISKAQERGWSGRTVMEVKTVLKDMAEEVRNIILDDRTRLPYKVILALKEIDPDKIKDVIEYIITHKYDEELALAFIEQVKKGESLILETVKVDEIDKVFTRFSRIYEMVSGLGYNDYKILGRARWYEALEILRKIQEKIQELLTVKYE